MNKYILTIASVMVLNGVSYGQSSVTTFEWVSGLSSDYDGEPDNTLTFSASGSGNVTTGSGSTFATPFSEFGSTLVLGAETINTSTVASFDYTMSFTAPITNLSIYMQGFSQFDKVTNFSIVPSEVIDVSVPTSTLAWDGTTVSASTGSGASALIKFEGPVSSISFTTETAGAGDSVGIQEIGWTTVPEPSSTALLGLGALGFILRRHR